MLGSDDGVAVPFRRRAETVVAGPTKEDDIQVSSLARCCHGARWFLRRLNRYRGVVAPVGQLCTLVLLAVLVWRLGPSRIGERLAIAGIRVIVVCATISLLGFVVLVMKWQVALRTFGAQPRFVRLLGLHLSSTLWGVLLPVPFSDELYRSGRLAATGVTVPVFLRAAVVDRCSTLFGVVAVGLVAAILQIRLPSVPGALLTLAFMSGFLCAGYILIRYSGVSRMVNLTMRRLLSARHLQIFERWTAWPRGSRRDTAVMIALATAAQMVFAGSFLIWTGGFGVHLSIAQSAWALSASALATYAVPLPGMGVAVQQGALVYVLVQMGASPEQAAAITICSLAMLLLFGGGGMVLEGVAMLRAWRERATPHVRPDLRGNPG